MARLNLGKELVDLIYPVGSTVFNKNADFDPNELWIGTTWENLGNCVLMGCGSNDSKYNQSGTYVGENEHILTIDEIPEHVHNNGYSLLTYYGLDGKDVFQSLNDHASGNQPRNYVWDKSIGGNQPHNNVQRSYLGYWWIRTS